MKKIGVVLLLGLWSGFSFASAGRGAVRIEGVCAVEGATSQTVGLISHGLEKSVLGYVGVDGGRYKISIANNGGGPFERTSGAVVVGFSRDEAPVSNPVELCPSSPEDLRRECLERNARNHPDFVPAPTDRFVTLPNDNGDVDAEVGPRIPGGHVDPDDFILFKVAVSGERIVDSQPVAIETPTAGLGGVRAHCSLSVRRDG